VFFVLSLSGTRRIALAAEKVAASSPTPLIAGEILRRTPGPLVSTPLFAISLGEVMYLDRIKTARRERRSPGDSVIGNTSGLAV
jgi:hypothetical protein